MLKEYINRLLEENNKKLNELEAQMKNLLNDLDCAKEWLDSLHAETNVDKNIFSPRVMDTDLDKKTENAQKDIEKTRQDIEYVRFFIEENVKKKLEYEKLLEEIEHMESEVESRTQEESYRNRKDILASFLAELYRKTELCLSLIYNDRTKCKSELKSMKNMIRDMADSLSE